MENNKSSGREFERLVFELFRRNDFEVLEEHEVKGRQIDALVTSKTGMRAVVEAKLFRGRTAPRSTLLNVIEMLNHARIDSDAQFSILVTTARIEPRLFAELKARETIVAYDYDRLIWLFSTHSDLAEQFARIVQETSTGFKESPEGFDPDRPRDTRFVELEVGEPPETSGATPERPAPKGRELCAQLHKVRDRAIAEGVSRTERQEIAQAFEVVATEAVKYAFSDNFSVWREQASNDDGVSRFDLVARLAPKSTFWSMIAHDFRCRYVVFEFKCYRDQIKQGQILTTEKYLFKPALRSVAIILSLNGADANAKKMAIGALRESGKLIIDLRIDQLCKMLNARDGAAGPDQVPADVEEELFNALDDMLIEMGR